jgi:hypothetical protein
VVKNAVESEGPTRETFSFEDYIAGISSFPGFSHTVYLDQAKGVEMATLVDRFDEVSTEGRTVAVRLEQMDETQMGMADDEPYRLTARLEQLNEQGKELARQIEAIEAEVKKSGLTVNFRAGTAQKYGDVLRAAHREFEKVHGKLAKNQDDPDYMAARARAVTVAQLAAYCVSVTLPDGREQAAPDENGFRALLDRLITSEQVRLMGALGKGLDSALKWSAREDAGFPGGGAELA